MIQKLLLHKELEARNKETNSTSWPQVCYPHSHTRLQSGNCSTCLIPAQQKQHESDPGRETPSCCPALSRCSVFFNLKNWTHPVERLGGSHGCREPCGESPAWSYLLRLPGVLQRSGDSGLWAQLLPSLHQPVLGWIGSKLLLPPVQTSHATEKSQTKQAAGKHCQNNQTAEFTGSQGSWRGEHERGKPGGSATALWRDSDWRGVWQMPRSHCSSWEGCSGVQGRSSWFAVLWNPWVLMTAWFPHDLPVTLHFSLLQLWVQTKSSAL